MNKVTECRSTLFFYLPVFFNVFILMIKYSFRNLLYGIENNKSLGYFLSYPCLSKYFLIGYHLGIELPKY